MISVPRTHSWVETSHTPTPPPKGDPAEPMGTASSAAKSGKEDDKRMSSKFNPIIMPLDVVVWTPTQLAPFIQKLAPHQPVDGKQNTSYDVLLNRPFQGFRRHLGGGAVAAKITANVREIVQLSNLVTPLLYNGV